MFLLVSVRHVGAHPGGHQHGVSIQIPINLGKTFLRISSILNIPLTWILARVVIYLPPFIVQILDFIYPTVLIFILIYFEWCDTDNQQFYVSLRVCRNWVVHSGISKTITHWLIVCFIVTAQSVQREFFFFDLWFRVSTYNERGKNVKKKLNSLNNTLEEGKTLI